MMDRLRLDRRGDVRSPSIISNLRRWQVVHKMGQWWRECAARGDFSLVLGSVKKERSVYVSWCSMIKRTGNIQDTLNIA